MLKVVNVARSFTQIYPVSRIGSPADVTGMHLERKKEKAEQTFEKSIHRG